MAFSPAEFEGSTGHNKAKGRENMYICKLLLFNVSFFLLSGTGVWWYLLSRQVLCHLSHSATPLISFLENSLERLEEGLNLLEMSRLKKCNKCI
jgi:hypothetical protein